MEARRRSILDKDKVPAAGEKESSKTVKKPEREKRDYDFSVCRSLFDDET